MLRSAGTVSSYFDDFDDDIEKEVVAVEKEKGRDVSGQEKKRESKYDIYIAIILLGQSR